MRARRVIVSTWVTKVAVSVALIAGLAACSSGSGGTSVEVPSRLTHIRVAGRVVGEGGEPVAGATVNIQIGISASGPGCQPTANETVTTDESGAFAQTIRSGPLNYEACITLAVTPPTSTGLAPRTVSAPSVQFRSTDEPAPESRIEVVLARQ
jgi:hypothetical protein